MIVRRSHDRVQLITQPDHAHAARAIMEHCVPLAGLPRRDAILYAIGEHDNGWAETDATPTVDPATGGVVDFVSAPLSVRHEVWPRAVARLAGDPWAATLVAQHAITVFCLHGHCRESKQPAAGYARGVDRRSCPSGARPALRKPRDWPSPR